MIGTLIYISVICTCIDSTIVYKVMQGKTWENISVRCGIYVAKAAMLTTGMPGPLIFFCLTTQLYYFSIIINHRSDSKPGATFLIHCFFVYFTMQQYFFRGSHRTRFDTIKFGKVCPGGVFCGEELHWILIFFECLAPFIVSLLLLPLVARARVSYAYASTVPKKSENKKETDQQGTKNGPGSKKVDDRKVAKLDDAQFPTEFKGNMKEAMQHLQSFSIVMVVLSSYFVWHTKSEVIFPDRSAPKFVFDACLAIAFVPFTVFWTQ